MKIRSPSALALAAALALPPGVSAQARIPLCPDLTLVGAVSEPRGDYEPIVHIDSVTAQAVHLTYSTEVAGPSGIVHTRSRRAVLLTDLADATNLAPWFGPGVARTIPGMTAIGPSRAVLRALKAGDTVRLGVLTREGSTLPARRESHPNAYEAVATYPLHRVEAEPVGVAVTLNGEKVTLPAIHVAGTYFDERAEFYFYDPPYKPVGRRNEVVVPLPDFTEDK